MFWIATPNGVALDFDGRSLYYDLSAARANALILARERSEDLTVRNDDGRIILHVYPSGWCAP